MPTIKERIENHLPLFFLGALAVGFGAGFGAYKAVLEASNNTTVHRDHLAQLNNTIEQQSSKIEAKILDLNNANSKLKKLEEELSAKTKQAEDLNQAIRSRPVLDAVSLSGTWVGTANNTAIRFAITQSGTVVTGSDKGQHSADLTGRTSNGLILLRRCRPDLPSGCQIYGAKLVNENKLEGRFCHQDPKHGWSCTYEWQAQRL